MSNGNIPVAYSVIDGVTIVIGTRSISWEHVNREEILKCIRDEKWDEIEELISNEKAINKFGNGKLVVIGNDVTYNGRTIDGALHERILSMIKMKLPVDPLVKFLDRIELNPSHRVIKELFNFLDKGQLPLTQDGCFLARKVVRGDFMDYHSGTVNWAPGETPEMPRNQVDDDPDRTCSKGLHVYNREYGKGFMSPGGKFLVVEVAPEDVVAIPYDYNGAKMRICKAKVLQEITNEEDPEFFSSLVYSSVRDYELDKDEDYKNYCTNCGCEIPYNEYLCDSCAEIECPDCGGFNLDPCTNICADCAEECERCGCLLRVDEYQYCNSCEQKNEDEENESEDYVQENQISVDQKSDAIDIADSFDSVNTVKDFSEGSGKQIWVFRKS